MGNYLEKNKNIRKNIMVLLVFTICISIRYYIGIVNCLNTTVMAFSYKYGFISRGFMGTVLRVCNLMVPGYNLVSYQGIVLFSIALDILFIVLMFIFFRMVLIKVDQNMIMKAMVLMFILMTFAAPEYLTEQNFGRSDVCLAMISLLAVMLILSEKFEWFIIPLVAIAVSIHQGYILMFFNVVLILLWVKIFDNTEKRRKYIIIFIVSILVSILFFLYFNFFSHANGGKIYDEIWNVASSLAHDGVVQYNLMDHEILGISPWVDEWDEHIHNFKEFPVFILLMFPYLKIAFDFFKKCIKDVDGAVKLKYLAIAVGSFTILPDIIVKIDYGRWMFSIIFYYFIVVLALIAMKDEVIIKNIKLVVIELKKQPIVTIFLMLYPLLFTPLKDVYICDLTNNIVEFFDKLMLGM